MLEDLGLRIKNTSKVTEEALALTGLLATSALAGLLFFLLLPRERAGLRVRRAGELVGGALGVVLFVLVLVQDKPATLNAKVVDAVWVVGVLLLWGWALARLHEVVYPAGVAAATAAAEARRAAPAEAPAAAAPAEAPAAAAPAEAPAAARVARRPSPAAPAAEAVRLGPAPLPGAHGRPRGHGRGAGRRGGRHPERGERPRTWRRWCGPRYRSPTPTRP